MGKKLVAVVVMVLMCMALVPCQAFAAPDNGSGKILLQVKEITDQDELFNRALNGVNEDPSFKGGIHSTIAKNKQTGETLDCPVYTTTQLLKCIDLGNNQQETEYVATSIAVLKLPKDEPKPSGNKLSTYRLITSQGDDTSDKTGAVHCYNTIYYTKRTDTYNNTWYKLTSASGYWRILDSSTTVSNAKNRLYQTGWGTGRIYSDYDAGWATCSWTSWSRSAPSSWPEVLNNSVPEMSIGCVSDITCTRGGSSWDFPFINEIKFQNWGG